MSLSRRRMLGLMGAGTVLVGGASVAGFATTRTPHAALAAWREAGLPDDPRLHALSWAILAPNPHNRQPWEIALVDGESMRIFRDRTRDLPHTDPYDRQLTIGMGCFLELLVIAATATGHGVELTLFPEGEDGPVADVRLVPDAGEPDPLFAHILARRTCRDPYRSETIPDHVVSALSEHAQVLTAPDRVDALRSLTREAFRIEALTPHTWMESVELTRVGRRAIEAQPDGIALHGVAIEAMNLFGMMSPEALADPDSTAFGFAMDSYDAAIDGTFAFAVLSTPGNTRREQIEAGRRWMRLSLAATGFGLGLHPLSQALQEYPEMAELHERAHDLLAPDGGTVQMLARLGYGSIAPDGMPPQDPAEGKSPRWPLATRLRDA